MGSSLFGEEPTPAAPEPPQEGPPQEGPGLFGDAPVPVSAAAATPYRVLARKYRPQIFDDLIGQEAMVRTLRNAFAKGRVAHAFMLTGVRGVGKTTTARLIARALNCTGPDGTGGPTADPCGVCANCTAILADRHPDVTEMDAASRTGVDDVREIIEATRFRPMQARMKVFVVDEVHMLSRNAFNALLKTLEEPPPHVTFVFATTELRKVPVTVLSRCQRFDLRRIGTAELAALFGRVAQAEGIAIEDEALLAIARAADGSARDGLSLLDQAIAQHEGDGAIAAARIMDMLGLADRTVVFDLLDSVLGGRVAEALAITARLHELGADPGLTLADLLELVHLLTRLRTVPALREDPALAELERVRGAALADRLSVPDLVRAWQVLLRGIGEVEQAPDRNAAAEMVLIRLCHAADLPPPGELVKRLAGASATGGTAAASALQSGSGSSGSVASGSAGSGGGSSGAVASGGAAVARAMPMASPAPSDAPMEAPKLSGWRDVVALAAGREPLLHAHLLHSAHLVRFAPPVIELRPEPDAPRDLAAGLSRLLQEVTGRRWTIAVSAEEGEATLAQLGSAADAARREAASEHPLVRAILAAFPGAVVGPVHDERADAYGLTPDDGDDDLGSYVQPAAPPNEDDLPVEDT
jgi:DNA polymerase-3 subunit gamma/tau